jgi:hypothetical protein
MAAISQVMEGLDQVSTDALVARVYRAYERDFE